MCTVGLSNCQGDSFPEITKKLQDIKELLDEEEESFSRTLDRGEKLFEQFAATAKEQKVKELNGKDVWRLYDTFGFPVDLTRLMAEESGLEVNEEEFEAAQAASKEASKATKKIGENELVKLDVHDIAALESNESVPKTDDSAKFSKCRGHLSQLSWTQTVYQTLVTLLLMSKHCSTTRFLCHPPPVFLKMPHSVSFLIGQAFTPNLVGRNMILEILLSMVSRTSP